METEQPPIHLRIELSDASFRYRSEDFWNYVNKTETCWLWTKPYQTGYGVYKAMPVHRISWMASNQKVIPYDKIVRHKCRNRNCMNPDHLEIGTQAENMADKVRDGTDNRGTKHIWHGSNHPKSKLKEDQVLIIYKSSVHPKYLALTYDVSESVIRSIKLGNSWNWLTHHK